MISCSIPKIASSTPPAKTANRDSNLASSSSRTSLPQLVAPHDSFITSRILNFSSLTFPMQESAFTQISIHSIKINSKSIKPHTAKKYIHCSITETKVHNRILLLGLILIGELILLFANMLVRSD
jgi:hypothetical protein